MPTTYTQRPTPDEYDAFYAGYLAHVPDGDVIHLLATQIDDTISLLEGLSDADAEYRYAPGKWSIKEVVGHLIDGERIFASRALRISRNDTTPLPGFDQDDYVQAARFDERTLHDLLGELRAVRRATVHLFRNLSDAAMERAGTANETPVSVRAIAHIVVGHEQHHARLLRERYLPALA